MLNLDTAQKLSTTVLWYKLITILPVLALVWVAVTLWGSFSPQFAFLKSSAFVTVAGLILLLTIGGIYISIWWKIFTYKVFQDHIEITSGVVIRHSKTINFNDLQSMNVAFGPLLAIFGLRKVEGFTSSPRQIIITGDGDSTHTQHVPDVLLIVEKELAQEIATIAQAGDVQKVQQA